MSAFSSPPQRPVTSDFEGFSIPDFISYIFFPIFILEKEPVCPFLIFSAKQGNYLVPFWYDAVLDLGLDPGSPALDASTIKLGYRGDGILSRSNTRFIFMQMSNAVAVNDIYK